MRQRADFYVLAAVLVALVQGGIQALSRSYYARLIPSDRSAQFFGVYNMLGKFAAILGPVLMGGVGLIARMLLLPPVPTAEEISAVSTLATRFGIGSVSILFLMGGVLLHFSSKPRNTTRT
jgi:MFS transporter, UMF1 family